MQTSLTIKIYTGNDCLNGWSASFGDSSELIGYGKTKDEAACDLISRWEEEKKITAWMKKLENPKEKEKFNNLMNEIYRRIFK
jgi:hypothetical protein